MHDKGEGEGGVKGKRGPWVFVFMETSQGQKVFEQRLEGSEARCQTRSKQGAMTTHGF
jgi:hypothetical protein